MYLPLPSSTCARLVVLATLVPWMIATPVVAQEAPASGEQGAESGDQAEESNERPTMETISADQKEDFVRFVEAGKEAYSNGKFEEAVPFFEKAYDIVPRPELHYRIALSHERAGHADEAVTYYRKFLDEKPDTEKRGQVEATIERLEGSADESSSEQSEVDEVDVAPPSEPERLAAQLPNLVYLELAGHGIASTINYERYLVTDGTLGSNIPYNLSLGAGFGHQPDGLNISKYRFTGAINTIPIFVNTNFFGDVHSFLLQGGLVIIAKADPGGTEGDATDGADSKLDRTAELFAQTGYQIQDDSGFLFRATLSVSSAPTLLPGLTLGWSF